MNLISKESNPSRRNFLSSAIGAPVLVAAASTDARLLGAPPGKAAVDPRAEISARELVSRADLVYTEPASRSEEGLPIGNGKMGSLVWTSPSSVHLQVNRCDVFAENCETHSFPERHADYGSGCAFVDLNFVDFGENVFEGSAFRQELSLYDGLMKVAGKDVTLRILACTDCDTFVIEVEDRREHAGPVGVDLRMLRYVTQYLEHENYALASEHKVRINTRNQSATSGLEIRDGRIVLTQEFREGKFFNGSAVAVSVIGRKSQTKYVHDSTLRISVAPGKGRFLILISSAASFGPEQDSGARALAEFEKVPAGFDAILSDNQRWWHDFWSKGSVYLHSADGEADLVEQHYTYFLYVMGATSRGDYPPRFGGLLWFTNGDMREWGSQHWWANAACYYDALPPANRFEVMEPAFRMYSKMYDSCSRAAEQQWGSKGIYIPETVFFDGLEDLGELSAEFRELYLLRKPWSERSEAFKRLGDTKQPHNSRWNWKEKGKWIDGIWTYHDKGAGPCGQTNHILSSGAKIAYLYWLRYEFTLDPAWLKERAYPMVKGIAEFYRNYPNLKKGSDGKYHIHSVNNHEPVWAAQDTNEEVAAMHGIFPVAIRASENLGVDSELRPLWKEVLENLTPIVTSDSRGAPPVHRSESRPIWIAGLPPALKGNLAAPGPIPTLEYDLCTVGTRDRTMIDLGQATYDAMHPGGINEKTPISVLNRSGASAAHLGRSEDIRHILPNQLRCLAPDHDFCDWIGGGKTRVLRNRLTLREGPGDVDAERIGRVAQALHLGLLQSVPPAPGEDTVIHVFPAFPKEWDAKFTLLARGAFLVSGTMQQGQIHSVGIVSQQGGTCKVRNPWGTAEVEIERNGSHTERANGELLTFSTNKGETIALRAVTA